MGFLGFAAIVFRLAVAVGVLALLGDGLDRMLHTAPWFLVAGIVLGVGVVIFDLERQAGRYRRRAKRSRRNRGARGAREAR
jgi:F0F1-type ATP synthase assembly protein I